MTLAMMTLLALILTGALFWRPVLGMKCQPPPVMGPDNAPVRVSVLHIPPLILQSSSDGKIKGILGEFFAEIVKMCFIKHCNLTRDFFNVTLYNTTQRFLKSIEDSKAEIAFPISRPLKMWLSHSNYTGPDMHFEDFFKSPGYSLIMDVGNVNEKANAIVMQTLLENTWPIIVVTLLFAGISGIFVWMLETFFNEEEFPRSFIKGSYEGCWWAFVSMTTVGYGDKTPKFVFGRLFGVAWILIGLVIIAIFTATATSALSVSASDLAKLEGTPIGVLHNTSAELEAKQYGAKVTAFPSVDRLFSELKSDKIHGILMDKYKAAFYLSEKNMPTFKVFKSFSVDINYNIGVQASSKLAEMNEESCFKSMIKKLDVDELLLKYLSPVAAYNEDSDSTSIFSGKAKTTQRFLLITMGVFLGLIVLGIIGEFAYKRLWKAKTKVQNGQDGIELKEVRVQSIPVKGNFKEIEDKLGQLVREVNLLQDQLRVISSQANGNMAHDTTRM